MEPFATYEDLINRFPEIGLDEMRANTLLSDATVMIFREMQRAGVVFNDGDEWQLEDLKIVTCHVVRRSVISEADGPYTQMTDTAGPYTQSRTLANPNGDMYLTARERKRLGIASGHLHSLRPKIEGADDSW